MATLPTGDKAVRSALQQAIRELRKQEARQTRDASPEITQNYTQLLDALQRAEETIERGEKVDKTEFRGFVRGVADWVPILDTKLLRVLGKVEDVIAGRP